MSYTEDGLEAIVFTAQGDMRQALNNLQSTHNSFGVVNSENVFKVCDEPHPMLIKEMLQDCVKGDIRKAYKVKLIFLIYICCCFYSLLLILLGYRAFMDVGLC